MPDTQKTIPAINRRRFIHMVGVTGALAVAGKVSASTPPAAPAAESGQAAATPESLTNGTPAVFAPTADGFTVSLPLAAPALVWVEYGETKRLGSVANSDPFGFVPHDDEVMKIRIGNLKPGTRYYWRVVTKQALPYVGNKSVEILGNPKEVRSKIYVTKTLAPNAAETRFSVWNDTHDKHETIRALHAARQADDDFMLWNGDMSNNVNARNLLAPLYVAPPGVDLADGPPIFVTRGNHDVRGLWASKMSNYVEYPGGQRPYYAFRTGPVAVIALDTGEDKPDNHRSFRGVAAFEPLIREQAAWLEEVTSRPDLRDAPYRLVMCHIPLRWTNEGPQDYTKKGFDRYSLRGRQAWQTALVKWGAQIVISGHTHRHVWMPATEEFPFNQLTGGGPRLDKATIISVRATAKKLNVRTTQIHDNSVLHSVDLKPLA